MVLQAGLAALLSRLGAGPDIAIGAPIAGRTDAALEDLIGFFVNTLVLRTDTSGRPSLRELVSRVRSGNLAAYSHQDVPFERLVEVINPARSLSRHPLFQVMLAFQNNAAVELELDGVAASFEAVSTATSKFDLSLSLLETRAADGSASGIVGTLEYATDLFDRASMVALVERLIRLLEGCVAAPDAALAGLDILSGAERAALLEGFNATVRAVPSGTLPELFAAQAAATPDAVAAVYQDRELSYAALEAHANRLAHHLRGAGVGPESVVALCVERSLEMVIGLIGILKAGAAYLPLDPSYPAERLAFMLEDAGAAVVVTQQGLIERLPVLSRPQGRRGAPRLIRLDADWGAIALQPATAPELRIEPEHPAYVIYTSGSTGTPKGVVVGHGGIPNLAAAQIERFAITAQARVLQFASPSFDAAVSEIATALLIGRDLGAATGRAQRRGSVIPYRANRRSLTRPCRRFCCPTCRQICRCRA